jgi:hypothetical protein
MWEVVGLERGPLGIVSTTEELLQRKSSGSGLEIQEYGRRGPSRWQLGTLYPQKLALTSPTCSDDMVTPIRVGSDSLGDGFKPTVVKKLELICSPYGNCLRNTINRCWILTYLYTSSFAILIWHTEGTW